MVAYQIIFPPSTEKFFKKTPPKTSDRIMTRIEQVAEHPRTPNVNLKQLKDPKNGYRLRVGDYRVIYILDHKSRRLIITKIDHRSVVYR